MIGIVGDVLLLWGGSELSLAVSAALWSRSELWFWSQVLR